MKTGVAGCYGDRLLQTGYVLSFFLEEVIDMLRGAHS